MPRPVTCVAGLATLATEAITRHPVTRVAGSATSVTET